MSELETDIVVIGAGPVGLFTIFQAGMLKMRCHVVDALGEAGGQCTALYPEKPIFDIPGYPSIQASELIDKLSEQAEPFEPVFHFGERVDKVERLEDERFALTTSAGTKLLCKAIVIAAGCGAFGPNRPPIEGLEGYEGNSVHYYVKRKEDFRGKRVVIAGGGDSAVDWALGLHDVAEKLYVVHRRPKFRAAPESVAQMNKLVEDGKIEMVVPYQLHGLEGDGKHLVGVTVKTLEGEQQTLKADCLLPFYGLAMELGPIAGWGLNIEKNHITVDPKTCQTSEKGIYAVGDIATYPGKLKLILCGFSEVAMACHSAYGIVHPDEALHFEYSTTKGVPEAA